MAYDINKFHKLGALKDLGLRVAQELEKTNQKIEDIEIPEYSLVKQGTAESGYLSTYYLTKDGAQVGEKINIPKDFLVNSADILEVDTADQPYAGAQVGDLYIDFVINSKTADATASHVYLPVNELVDAYTSGNGIDISASNVVSVKIDSANANGLEVGAAGLKLNAATASTPGAMSAADKAKFLLQSLGCCIRYIHIAISRMPFLYAFIDQEFLHFLTQLPSSVLREYLKHTHGTFRVETCKTSEAPVLDYLPYLLCLYAFMYVIKSIMIVLCSFLSMLFCKRRYQAVILIEWLASV